MDYVLPSHRRTVRVTNINATASDTAKLMLRLALGLLILVHGISKIKGGIGPVFGAVDKAGLPHAFAYLVYIGEVIAPLLVVFGLWTRPAALVIAVNMIVAVLLVHTGQLLSLSAQGGYALELQALYFVVALVVALIGAGRYSIGGIAARWN